MYHEIGDGRFVQSSNVSRLSPTCILDRETFGQHMDVVSSLGYETIGFSPKGRTKQPTKPIVITFDDGLAGNHRFALPILLHYGMRAVFFVSTDLIGRPGYMKMEELQRLVDAGMEVQSHGTSHTALRNATPERLELELTGSKIFLEDHLGVKVDALSWPHGSYSKYGLDVARFAGYHVVCTSDARRNGIGCLDKPFAVYGRVAVTSGIDPSRFIRILEGHNTTFVSLRLQWLLKTLAKRMIGEGVYGVLYRKYYGISRHDYS